MARWLAYVILACQLAGCANFNAASTFATETGKLTSMIGTEFGHLVTLCDKQANLSIVIIDSNDQPLKDCERFKAAQGRLAGVTVDVLDRYAKTLSALTEDKAFDMSSDIENLAGKVNALKDPDGGALANEKAVTALSKVVQVLADVAKSARREAAVRRLVEETPNLRTTGDILRSFFVSKAELPADSAIPPYGNLIAIISDTAASNEASLRSPAFANKEPIRTAELRRELKGTQALLEKRGAGSGDSVPNKIVAAIDAWQAALSQFERDALIPDPDALFTRLNALRTRTIAARDAVESGSR